MAHTNNVTHTESTLLVASVWEEVQDIGLTDLTIFFSQCNDK